MRRFCDIARGFTVDTAAEYVYAVTVPESDDDVEDPDLDTFIEDNGLGGVIGARALLLFREHGGKLLTESCAEDE